MDILKNTNFEIHIGLRDLAKGLGGLVIDKVRNLHLPESGYSPTHHEHPLDEPIEPVVGLFDPSWADNYFEGDIDRLPPKDAFRVDL